MPGTVLDTDQVYEDVDAFILKSEYEIRAFGYDRTTPKRSLLAGRLRTVPSGSRRSSGRQDESVPLGELKKLSEERVLIDELLMQFAMGNAITIEDTSDNRKLLKKRMEEKIDNVAASWTPMSPTSSTRRRSSDHSRKALPRGLVSASRNEVGRSQGASRARPTGYVRPSLVRRRPARSSPCHPDLRTSSSRRWVR
jgi:hypothetical protein